MKRFRVDSTVIVLAILVLTLIVGAILVGTVGRNFLSPGNIRDILTGMSVLGLVAIGQTLVILGASLDLSVTYVISLSSLLAATIMNGSPANIPAAVAITVLVCAGIGLVNGLIVTVLKVNGFIATLGVGLILQGILNTNFEGSAGKVPWEFQLIGAAGVGRLADRRPRLCKLIVDDARAKPRAGLHDNVQTKRGKPFHRIRRSGNPWLPTFDFTRNEYDLSHVNPFGRNLTQRYAAAGMRLRRMNVPDGASAG